MGEWYPPLRFANEASPLHVATIFLLVGEDIILPYIMSGNIRRYTPYTLDGLKAPPQDQPLKNKKDRGYLSPIILLYFLYTLNIPYVYS